MATIVRTGGGVPISDYEALQNSYNSYKSNHGHTNDEYNSIVLEGATVHVINQHIWINADVYNYSFKAPAYGIYILAFCIFGAWTSDRQGMAFTPQMACTRNGAPFNNAKTSGDGGAATGTIKNNGRSAYLITFNTVANAGDTIACSCNPCFNYWNGQLFHAVGYYK